MPLGARRQQVGGDLSRTAGQRSNERSTPYRAPYAPCSRQCFGDCPAHQPGDRPAGHADQHRPPQLARVKVLAAMRQRIANAAYHPADDPTSRGCDQERRDLAIRVGVQYGIVKDVPVQIRVPRRIADGVLAEKAAQRGRVEARPVVVVATLGVVPPPGEQVGITDGGGRQRHPTAVVDGDGTIHVVLVALDDRAVPIRDLGDAAQRVAQEPLRLIVLDT